MSDWNPATSDSDNRLDQQKAQSEPRTRFHEELNHKPSYLGAVVDSLAAPFVSDQKTLSEVELYGTNFIKSATLFLRGRLGVAGTLASYALDQMRPGDSAATQLADGTLGSAKGLAMRGVFNKLGTTQVDFATKGIMLGTTSRLADSALSRQTYLDEKGQFSFGDGLGRIKDTAFNPAALTADVVTFGIAHGAFRGGNLLSNGALERSPLASTILTGTTFGASSGAYTEINRQKQNGEQLDIGKIAQRALIQGGLDSIAAIPGGMQARTAAVNEGGFKTRVKDLQDSFRLEQELGLRDARAISRATDGAGKNLFSEITSAARSGDPVALKFVMAQVRPEEMPHLTNQIIATTSGGDRQQLLSSMRMYTLAQMPTEHAVQAARDILTQTAQLPTAELGAARIMWDGLPKGMQGEADLRTAVAQQMAPQDLARIVFGDHAKVFSAAQELATTNPDVVREAAKAMPYSELDGHTQPILTGLVAFKNTRSVDQTVTHILEKTGGEKTPGEYAPAAQFVEHLYKQANPQEQTRTLTALRDSALMPVQPGNEARTAMAIDMAAHLAKVDPLKVNEQFFKPVQSALNSGENGFHWQQFVSSEANILRYLGKLEPTQLHGPELKLRGQQGIDTHEQTRVRTNVEQALRDPNKLEQMLGEGELGTLFPAVFGYHGDGGIVGRPQHSGHEFSLDTHTVMVLDNARHNPRFAKLSEKDQTNVLWAALLHDVGKRANEIHPAHEPISAAIGWGVLETLGYSAQRIQRITNLVSDHQLMSYLPDPHHFSMLNDPAVRDQLATRYQHSPAVEQLHILNESDIRALDSGSTYWTPEVAHELKRRSDIVQSRTQELSRYSVPILTTELPHEFKLLDRPGDYAFMAYKPENMGDAFFKQLPAMETRDNAIPISYLTPKQAAQTDQPTNIIALMTGPPEQTKLAQPTSPELDGIRSALAKYDTFTELQRANDQQLLAAHQSLLDSISQMPQTNLRNPALSGIGVYRRGQPVVFEGLADPAELGITHKPEWLRMEPAPNTVVIPRAVWQNAQRIGVPIIMLD